MKSITPFLWFDNQAEEAMEFYTSIFPDSKILNIARYGDAGPGVPGSVMTATFELLGQQIMVLNGGPVYSLTPAISFFVSCESQEEVDAVWDRLIEGGVASQCGWLQDKFGLSWQIIPTALMELMSDPDPEKSQRVMQAMLQMVKIDVAGLETAHAGHSLS